MCRTMVIAVETERSERELQRRVTRDTSGRSGEHVLYIGSVLSVFHPDALLECIQFVQLIAKAGYIGL